VKILAWGNNLSIHRLSDSLSSQGIEVIAVSGVPDILDRIKESPVDLVVLDSGIKDIEKACQEIQQIGTVPLALLIEEARPDWGKLLTLHVDGYLSRKASRAELAARVRAISRGCINLNDKPL
jgi:DNA-binding response OmpR family regulator